MRGIALIINAVKGMVMTSDAFPSHYKGLQIHATNGLHEQMLAMFQKYVPAWKQVLDVGAGAGAFSLRLHDHGYRVVGLDVNAEYWQAQGVPFITCDLNSSFQAYVDETFDAVCCMEVIEHIENPWQLMRGIKAVLRPGGIAIISTPNVESFYSRLLYLRTGIPHWFGERHFIESGHINPITSFEMSLIAKSVGLTIQEMAPGGYLPVVDFSSFGPRKWLRNVLCLGAYLVSRGEKNGQVTIFVLQNPRPAAAADTGAEGPARQDELGAPTAS
jgi:2-polyprenyl-3-methyl-5-hydroxy-6-metoxy-1,4-benzoquinol methylase